MGAARGRGRRHRRGRRGDRDDRGQRRRRRRRSRSAQRGPKPAECRPRRQPTDRAATTARAAAEAERRRRRSRPRCAARCSNTASTRRTIKGTGKDGRLTKEDVLAAAQAKQAAPAPGRQPRPRPRRLGAAPPAAGERREERVKMTRLRQTIARRLKEAQETAALLTTFNDCRHDRGDRGARDATRTCSRRSTASSSASWASSPRPRAWR